MMAWNSLPEAERRSKEQEGMAAWKAWVEKHDGAIVARHRARTPQGPPAITVPEHDPEKWIPVFGKDHAQTKKLKRNTESIEK